MKIIAETYVSTYFKTLSENKQIIPGLLLGQTTKEKTYIIHAVRNKDYAEVLNDADSDTKDIGQYFDSLIDHAQQVSRMLPGGTYVLGLFFISDDNIFNKNANSLQSVIQEIRAHLKTDESSHLNFVLHYNFSNEKISCKLVDQLSKDNGLTVDFKKITWYHFQSFFNFDELPSLYFSEEVTLKAQAEEISKRVEALLNESVFTFNGVFSDKNTWVKSLISKNVEYRNKKNIPIDVNIHLPCPFNENGEKEPFHEKSFVAKIICQGVLGSNVYLNEDATVGDTVCAVKSDILRSLASRIEMHLDSLLESEVNFQEIKTVHEPPRRILINLPESEVQLSDYLFPGETPSELSEALESLKDLLHIDINSSTIKKDFEDPSNANEETVPVTIQTKPSTPTDIESTNSKSIFIIVISAVIVVLLAIIYQLFLKH